MLFTERHSQAPQIDVMVRVSKDLETSFVPQMFFIEGMFDRLTSIGIFFQQSCCCGICECVVPNQRCEWWILAIFV